MTIPRHTIDSITQPANASEIAVVARSHCGTPSGRDAAELGVSGVVYNGAAVGRDDIGIESLPDLDCPAAAADHESAHTGYGVDMAKHGTISGANGAAANLGGETGQNALDCATPISDSDVDSAHIGDPVSAWEGGVVSHVNSEVASPGVVPRDTTRGFAATARESPGAKSRPPEQVDD